MVTNSKLCNTVHSKMCETYIFKYKIYLLIIILDGFFRFWLAKYKNIVLFFRTPLPTTYEEPYWLFRISFYYYVLIGAIVVVIIALPVSWLTRKEEDPPVHPDLISPCIHWTLPENEKPPEYLTVEGALKKIQLTEKDILQSSDVIKKEIN